MATGGSGDLLTGGSRSAARAPDSPYDAARLGAWLCGRAAELTLGYESEESMTPTIHCGTSEKPLKKYEKPGPEPG